MMDMRSTLANTARAAQNTRCDQYGIFLIQVDSHMGARPLCAPFQGRIFSRNGTRGVTADGSGGKIEYTPLSETSYGEPAGLFGVNCGHVQYPFFPGASFQSYFPYPEEENAERYKQFQTQRRLERNIRAAKRECMMLNETGDKEEFAKASLRLKNQRAKYREYCKKTGLAEHNDRTQVYGFDRSVSGKTVWAQRKNSGGNISGNGLTKSSKSDNIKPYEIKKTRAERKAIIEKAKAQERPIFAEDTDENKFASYVRNVPPKEGYYDVALHGAPTYAEFFGEPIDAYTLANILRNREDYTAGTKVRLLSCSTGDTSETGNCFAQLLANELGVEVEAPNKTLFVNSDGTFFVGDNLLDNFSSELKHFWSRKN